MIKAKYLTKITDINKIYLEDILQEGDIVVENVEELRQVLKQISEEFANIRNSVNKVRKLSYK